MYIYNISIPYSIFIIPYIITKNKKDTKCENRFCLINVVSERGNGGFPFLDRRPRRSFGMRA